MTYDLIIRNGTIVDGHALMDAQVFWDPLGTSFCYQGVPRS